MGAPVVLNSDDPSQMLMTEVSVTHKKNRTPINIPTEKNGCPFFPLFD